jgi:hypothetical protein
MTLFYCSGCVIDIGPKADSGRRMSRKLGNREAK